MVRCNLAHLMERKKVKISELSKASGIHRNTLTALKTNSAQRIELSVIKEICEYLKCSVGELFELVDDE